MRRDQPDASVRTRPGVRRRIVIRIIGLLITAISLYVVLPGLIRLFGDIPALRSVFPAWFVPVFVLESLAFVSIWELQRIAIGTHNWFDVATAQLAGNALSRALPGGVATGGATQYQMLTRAGFEGTTVTTSLTAVGLLSTATLFTLPVLVLPALIFGLAVDSRLLRGAVIAAVVAIFLLSGVSLLFFSDRVAWWVGRVLDWLVQRVRRSEPAKSFVVTVLEARDFVRAALADSWKRAVLAAYGNQLFDYAALVRQPLRGRRRLDPVPVLLAFVLASVLAMIPLTPGGLGFVEAGLTGVLTLAGVPADQAVLGVLMYRLFSYWLPLPAGAIAWGLYVRRRRVNPATS